MKEHPKFSDDLIKTLYSNHYIDDGTDWPGIFCITFGKDLVPMIDPTIEGALLKKIPFVRAFIQFNFGIDIHGIRLMDDLTLSPNQYQISYVNGSDSTVLAHGHVKANSFFVAKNPSQVKLAESENFESVDYPANSTKGVWISCKQKPLLENGGQLITGTDYVLLHFINIAQTYIVFESNCQRLKISDREKEVIKSAIMGQSNQEIAAKLFIAESTVKQHLQSIFEKADISRRSELNDIFMGRRSTL